MTKILQWDMQNETLRSGGVAGSARETPPGLVLRPKGVSKGRRLEHKNCDHFADAFGLRLPDWEDALRMAMQRSG